MKDVDEEALRRILHRETGSVKTVADFLKSVTSESGRRKPLGD